MAIVDDIRKDARTKNVLQQTNTKTVGPPSPETGLVGDQQPASVFTVADYDDVRNQVHLENKNFELINALNIMGQITNTQSQSGPIPGTMSVKSGSDASSGTIFAPDAGQVWQLMGLAVGTFNASGINIRFNDGTNTMLLATSSGAGLITTVPDLPVYVSAPGSIDFVVQSSSGNNVVQGAFIRVR
jgi:hypothetical protein